MRCLYVFNFSLKISSNAFKFFVVNMINIYIHIYIYVLFSVVLEMNYEFMSLT